MSRMLRRGDRCYAKGRRTKNHPFLQQNYVELRLRCSPGSHSLGSKKIQDFPRLSRTLHLDFRDFPVLEILQTQFQNFLFLGLSRRRGNPGRDPDRRETVGKLYPGSYISVQNRSSPTCLNMTRHLLYIIG